MKLDFMGITLRICVGYESDMFGDFNVYDNTSFHGFKLRRRSQKLFSKGI